MFKRGVLRDAHLLEKLMPYLSMIKSKKCSTETPFCCRFSVNSVKLVNYIKGRFSAVVGVIFWFRGTD
jgi:hypothetical protein